VAQEFRGEAEWSETFSRSDFLAMAGKVEQLMAAQMPELTMSYDVHLKKPDSTLNGSTLAQLESELDDAAWSHLRWADVWYYGRREENGDIALHAWLRARHPTSNEAAVAVHGVDRTAVEGITVQLQEFGDDLLRASRESAATAVVAHRKDWLNNPWVVTIVGGIIVTVVGAIIVAIILAG
jgi:hypothetical protein